MLLYLRWSDTLSCACRFQNKIIVFFHKYSQALVIMDNKNLEELFEEQQLQKMEIYGNVSIVGNMRLCRVKIDHFMNSTGVPGQSDDLFKSNGQKLPCKFCLFKNTKIICFCEIHFIFVIIESNILYTFEDHTSRR